LTVTTLRKTYNNIFDMELKEKPCKGIGKANGVKGCGTKTKFRNHGLCMKCYPDFILNTDAGRLIMQKSIIKAKVKVKAESKQRDAKTRESLKTLSDWKRSLQTEINTIVRLIDNGYPCIATGRNTGKRNAGHYISVGSNDTIRFHLENIWVQSEESNTHQSGDTIKYQQGIIDLLKKHFARNPLKEFRF